MTITLFVLFVLMQAADVLTTYIILSRGGREVNPVVALAIEKLGLLNGLYAVKIPLTVLLGYVAFTDLLPWWGLVLPCLIYVPVLVNNIREVTKNG